MKALTSEGSLVSLGGLALLSILLLEGTNQVRVRVSWRNESV